MNQNKIKDVQKITSKDPMLSTLGISWQKKKKKDNNNNKRCTNDNKKIK